jgi:hypothetical protein
MKFDYTYIHLFGLRIYEPLVIVTNLILLIISVFFFARMVRLRNTYSANMAWFILLLGISGCFGAVIHATHYQLGTTFLKVMNFVCNVINLVAAYLCFRGSYFIRTLSSGRYRKAILSLGLAWLVIVVGYSLIESDFIIITVHAGVVLLYALFAHAPHVKKEVLTGSGLVIAGICTAFLSILVHLLHISLHEWFNHKDLAHIFMILSLGMIGQGILVNARILQENPVTVKAE